MSEGLCRGNSCCVVEEELEDVEFMRRTLYFAVRSLRWFRSVYGISLSTITRVKLEFSEGNLGNLHFACLQIPTPITVDNRLAY